MREIGEGLRKVVPILRSALRSQTVDTSAAILEIDETIAEYRKCIDERYPGKVRQSLRTWEGSMQNWVNSAGRARPDERRAYEAGLEAIERRIEGFKNLAALHFQDEARASRRG
ncbi:MAG: hypothetical protein IPM55_02435 [Acidobacteria bacterium]|nr:hypothetical protein [Acidobacteriota bacterium]